MQPTLAIIDVDIQSGQDEAAREALLTNLHGLLRSLCPAPVGEPDA